MQFNFVADFRLNFLAFYNEIVFKINDRDQLLSTLKVINRLISNVWSQSEERNNGLDLELEW